MFRTLCNSVLTKKITERYTKEGKKGEVGAILKKGKALENI